MVIQAIPTTFRGIKYRSILEANWAQWLRERGFNAQYEKRKFKLERGIWYLPDFYIPEIKTFIEVKGNMERVHKPYQLTQQLKRECPKTWPDGGTMLLLAGPVGTLYNTEYSYFMGFNLIHCDNCTLNSIVTEYGNQSCRYCGNIKDTRTIEKIPASQKPLKWLLLERD
jgi:hypothetical protein